MKPIYHSISTNQFFILFSKQQPPVRQSVVSLIKQFLLFYLTLLPFPFSLFKFSIISTVLFFITPRQNPTTVFLNFSLVVLLATFPSITNRVIRQCFDSILPVQESDRGSLLVHCVYSSTVHPTL